MTTCERVAALAEKLELTQDQILLIYAFNHFGLGKPGIIRTLALVSKIVERYNLSDSFFDQTYGQQLVEKGVLTPEEGAFFEGTLHEESVFA